MKTVLFVCVENSCRSQMAEAFTIMLGSDVIEVYSSGSHPSGQVNQKAITSMNEIGYDMKGHRSKGFEALPDIVYDLVVTMGCGDACPLIQTKEKKAWNVPDPKQMELKQFNEVRDLIRQRVIELIETAKGKKMNEVCIG